MPIAITNLHRMKYILIANYVADTAAEIELNAVEWMLPDSVDDADITLAGKTLSSRFEEDRQEVLQAAQVSEGTNARNNQCCKSCEQVPKVSSQRFTTTTLYVAKKTRHAKPDGGKE